MPLKPTALLLAGLLFPVFLLTPIAAQAGAAEELVGLLLQGCLPFVGNPTALRGWAQQKGLHPVPEQARLAFLHGAPGQVFDASELGVKLVLVSSDDGICSAATEQATEQQVIDALETAFRQVGLQFRLIVERDDKQISAIHDREYLAAKDKVGWRILAATVKGDKGGQAMLTAAPE